MLENLPPTQLLVPTLSRNSRVYVQASGPSRAIYSVCKTALEACIHIVSSLSSIPEATENINDTGESVTQDASTYQFVLADGIVNIIDVPGMGDTRGDDQDKRNFDKILMHLSSYEEIHGICILLKPNEARLTILFEYCIKELLRHLHIVSSVIYITY